MRTANRDCAPLVARREPFTGSNLQGGPRGTIAEFGYLPGEWRNIFCADEPDYVVWSYQTPIVWHGRRGWTVPDVRYSASTARQLSYVTRNLPTTT